MVRQPPTKQKGQAETMYCPICKDVQTVRSEINQQAITPWTCRKSWICERCYVTIAIELLPKDTS